MNAIWDKRRPHQPMKDLDSKLFQFNLINMIFRSHNGLPANIWVRLTTPASSLSCLLLLGSLNHDLLDTLLMFYELFMCVFTLSSCTILGLSLAIQNSCIPYVAYFLQQDYSISQHN